MNELWKGIAIAGIWIACAAVVILPAFAAASVGKGNYNFDGELLFLFATIATAMVAYA